MRRTPCVVGCWRWGLLAALALGNAVATPVRAQAPAADLAFGIDLAHEHERYRARLDAAARESLVSCVEWLGPQAGALSLTDRPGASGAAADTVVVELPWWSAPTSMDVETLVAFRVARRWWPRTVSDADAALIVDAAAWYLQSRIVDRLFDARFGQTAHSTDTVRFFGGVVPWTWRMLPLSRWTAGLGRGEHAGATAGSPRARGALAFGTLERYLTWPVLQGALRAWASRAASTSMTRADIVRTLGDAAGQDLLWFFDAAFNPARRFDYALDDVVSVDASCDAGPCVRTGVTVRRRGDAVFSGRSEPPVGRFPSGDALELRLTFADGTGLSSRWDGRDEWRREQFESRSPVATVRLDPDRILLLDASYLDDGRDVRGETSVPVAKWAALWITWLQNAMLTYGALL